MEKNKMFKCKKCDSTKYVLREKGTATGLYCAKCGFWHKWVAKSDLVRYKVGMHQSNDYEQKMLNWANVQDWRLIDKIVNYDGGREYTININGVGFAINDFSNFEADFIKLIAKYRI